MNEWSMYLHVIGDAMNNLVVIVNACIIKYCVGLGDARFFSDPITSLLMCTALFVQTLPLITQSSLILMETAPESISEDIEDIDELKRVISGFDHVVDVHEVHLWRLDQSTTLCTAHVVVQSDDASVIMRTLDRIKGFLHENGLHSSSVQVELIGTRCRLEECTHEAGTQGCIVLSSATDTHCLDIVCDPGSGRQAECAARSCCAATGAVE
eukprot:CAMPEP_0206236200 /NCGR_PEP_ID=MMETSP0047_2-20121206/13579_1 /ASSEMBLY_ACC=CAM_ASM_000192 /TAXON_ID=195065 /ORGANISM="Chroomonas mesostigmatica_cf, Strain CCMP1168" /LENGTH=210 /DNA_ID=CAMNT_0053660501 /DNA_START=25 /DNA_END=657 /DNA_ORIENTATION=+